MLEFATVVTGPLMKRADHCIRVPESKPTRLGNLEKVLDLINPHADPGLANEVTPGGLAGFARAYKLRMQVTRDKFAHGSGWVPLVTMVRAYLDVNDGLREHGFIDRLMQLFVERGHALVPAQLEHLLGEKSCSGLLINRRPNEVCHHYDPVVTNLVPLWDGKELIFYEVELSRRGNFWQRLHVRKDGWTQGRYLPRTRFFVVERY